MATGSPYGPLSADVHAAYEELSNLDESQLQPEREAKELFNLPNSAQIFFISGDGKVSTFSEPSSLRIFKFKDRLENEPENVAFIQVNGWTHPLIPGVSPVLEAENGAFMFPDDYADQPGSSVGIVIVEDCVYNVDGEAHALLAKILAELTALKQDVLLSEDQRLGKIGKTLVKGAETISKGLGYGAEKASQLIEYVGEKEKQKAIAKGVPPSEVKISPALKTTLKGAMLATNATVRVSGFVANRVGKLTKSVADHLANRMEKPVTTAVVGTTGGKHSKSSSMHNLVDAARGGLLAYGTVYAGLESSAKALGKSLKEHTVKVVEVKYGQEASQVTNDGISAAGNAALTYMNIQSLGVKGLLKKTAKDTGKSLGKKVLDAHVSQDKKLPLE